MILDDDPPEPSMNIQVPDQPSSLDGVDDEFCVDDERQMRIRNAHEMRVQVILYSFIIYLTDFSHLVFVGTL
jgi:hypothetical protein